MNLDRGRGHSHGGHAPGRGHAGRDQGAVRFAVAAGELVLPERIDAASGEEEIRAALRQKPFRLVAATVGEDEHSVGMREILDIKHGGLEGFGFKGLYLGTSVPVDKMINAAVEFDADAILISTIISHAEIHRQNMRRLHQLCVEKGVRDRFPARGRRAAGHGGVGPRRGLGRRVRPGHQGDRGGQFPGAPAAGREETSKLKERITQMHDLRMIAWQSRDGLDTITNSDLRGEPWRTRGRSTSPGCRDRQHDHTGQCLAGLDGDDPRLVGQAQALTTVEQGDVLLGLREALAELEKQIGPTRDLEILATSSAAGGLSVTVHGLVYEMTVRAAREAALGAGAVVRLVTAGMLESGGSWPRSRRSIPD